VGFFAFLKILPRFFVWVLGFLFGSCIYLGDWAAYRLLSISRRSQYVRMGGCARTGQCCRNLALEIPGSWAKRAWIVKLFAGWYRAIFNFHYLGQKDGGWMIFECHHLRDGNVCSIYPYRPKLCREFPQLPLFGHGRLHKGCGFHYLKRSEVGKFGEALANQKHEREKLEYMNQQRGD
jgi:Fe-S-cluster containining protein